MSRGIENSITQAGLALIARSLAESSPVVFTGAKLGEGVAQDSDDLTTFTALIDEYDDAAITSKSADSSGHLIITVSYWNTNVSTTVSIDEIGIWARLQSDPASAAVLFSYLTLGGFPDLILANSEASVQRTYDLPFSFGAGAASSVTIVPSGLLPASDAVSTAEAGKLLRLDSNGKLPTDITGSAMMLGGHTYDWFSPADHSHTAATGSAAGFMSAVDKNALDTLAGYVNQSVATNAIPTFGGLVVNGYIDGAMFR